MPSIRSTAEADRSPGWPRPLPEDLVLPAAGRHVERQQVAGHLHLVEADAANASELGVDARVVMAEEA